MPNFHGFPPASLSSFRSDVHSYVSENKRDERLMKDMKKPRAHIINHTKVTHSIKKRRHDNIYIYAKSTHKTYDEEKMRRETKNMCHPRISKLDKRAKPYG